MRIPHRLTIALAVALATVGLGARQTPAGGAGSGDDFNDSHFHLTNYVQKGIDVRAFLQIMGTRVHRSTLFGIPLQQTVVVRELRRLRTHLLPAKRRTSLLLLVH